jgi:hypothetical protein
LHKQLKTINKQLKTKKLMKKIFTLLTMALLAIGASAQDVQTLIDYPTSQSGITLNSSKVTITTVKLKTNTTSTACINFSSGYFNDTDGLTGNDAKLSVEGGFKAGDVITIAGAFNNNDNTKKSAIDIFIKDENAEKGYVVLFTTAQFVNGRLVNDDPEIEKFTLEADYDELYLGRNGNTGTNVTTLKVTRGETVEAEDVTFTLSSDEIWIDQTAQIKVNDKSNLGELTLQNITYGTEGIVTVDETGKVTPVAAGETTIQFTTEAVEGKYNAGAGNLTIKVKDVEFPEFGQWNFSHEAFTRFTTISDEITIAGLTLTNGIEIDDKTPKEEDGYSFTHRLKLNKTEKANYRTLSFTATNDCNILVYAISGNKDAKDRKLIIKSGAFDGTDLYNDVVLGDKLYKISVENVKAGTTIYMYADAGVNLYGIFVAEPAESHVAATWDFTQPLSSADEAVLSASPWTYDEEASPARYKNTETLTEKNVQVSLGLELTDGLKFTSTSSDGLTADKVRIFPAKYLSLNGEKHQIVVEGLAKNDKVNIRFASTAEEGAEGAERGFNVSNATPESVMSSNNTDIVEAKLTATADGNMFFTTTGGVYVYAIAINTTLPEYTGISVINAETEGAADAPVYNLSGQRVDENYRGVVIKNGKKMIK